MPSNPSRSVDGLGSFSGAEGLAALLRDDPRTGACLVKNVYRHAVGVYGGEFERPADELARSFVASGRRVRSLLVDLVASPAFRVVADPAGSQP